MKRRRRNKQLDLRYRTWGGKRPGAGRPRTRVRPLVAHRRRALFNTAHPLHVTIRLIDGMPNLRRHKWLRILEAALAEWSHRDGVKIVHFSVQRNHIHLIIEASGGRAALSRAMKGLKVRITRNLNRELGRTGTVFEGRYDDQVLDKPKKVRNALAYVLNNWRRHRQYDFRGSRRHDAVDPCSSGEAFDGWKWDVSASRDGPPPVTAPGTWMLRAGWRRGGGRIAPDYVPVAGR